MSAVSGAQRAPSAKFDRRDLRDTEESFGPVISDIARMLWPKGTAAEIAALADCSVRNVELYLSGKQKWSGDALAVIVGEILRRHRMRNVRVIGRQ